MSQVDPTPSDQLLETLKVELHNCQTQFNQAHIFLTEICTRLHSTQELINQYQKSAEVKEERITKLEQELKLKSNQLEAVNYEHDELRKRIKSEQHNASQYKAALHRCLDTSNLSGEDAKQVYTQARELTYTSCEEPSLTQSHHSVKLSLKQVEAPKAPKFIQDLAPIKQTVNNHQVSNHQLSGSQPYKSETAKSEPAIAKHTPEERPKSTIKLPQFAPLKPR
jgi:chromosome segregation ATPase